MQILTTAILVQDDSDREVEGRGPRRERSPTDNLWHYTPHYWTA
jgi:hypothetical protein